MSDEYDYDDGGMDYDDGWLYVDDEFDLPVRHVSAALGTMRLPFLYPSCRVVSSRFLDLTGASNS